MIDPLVASFLSLLGLSVGSFLGICVYRLPFHRSVVLPASHCIACGRLLKWFENIPLLSYIALRGNCRICDAKISFLYPTIEAITACLFVLQYWHLGLQPLLAVRLVFCCAMVVLFFLDLQHRILPNTITLPGIVIGLTVSLFFEPGLVNSLVGVAVTWVGLLGVAKLYYRIRGEQGLGMGDVKMLAMIGAFLGWQLALITLFLASVFGSITSIGILVLGFGDRRYALPLGSFLAVSAILVTLVGEQMLRWYVALY